MQENLLLSKPEWYMCSPVYVGDEISWSAIIGTNEFHSDLISLFEKLDKTIEIGNNEWHGAPFGEIETEPRNLRI
jgi:hypothetical protein